MEAIKTTHTVRNGQVNLQLPKQFWNQQVEIIILTKSEKKVIREYNKKSLRGYLQQHADPTRIVYEKKAWHDAISEKYGHR